MFGQNPIRPPVKGTGEQLDVQEIFPTFQGEGPYTGWPAVFVRLGGCNLACSFCDTEFEAFQSWAVADILAEVEKLSKNQSGERVYPLVVITGGEPFRQPIELLCSQLLEAGFKVQIETNGTLFRDIDRRVDIICSPKNTGTGYHPIRPDLLERITALKFLISAQNPWYNHVPEVGQTRYKIPVYIQPIDEYNGNNNINNNQLTIDLARQKGYKLSLQTHKLWGIP